MPSPEPTLKYSCTAFSGELSLFASIASIPGVAGGCQSILGINFIVDLGGMPAITLPTGEVGDEGLFEPAEDAFAEIGGPSAYINCPGVPDPVQDEHSLDGLAGMVKPARTSA